jgi:hypothetical protein
MSLTESIAEDATLQDALLPKLLSRELHPPSVLEEMSAVN